MLVDFIRSKLLGVLEISRHGARSTFTFSDKSSQLLYDSQKGQLTINGYRQHQMLGKILRKQYMSKHKLLSNNFDQDEIEIFSTPTQRTIFSASAQISGLFPNRIIKIIQTDDKNFRNDDEPPFFLSKEDIDDLYKDEIVLNIGNENQETTFFPLNCKFANQTTTLRKQYQKKEIFSFKEGDLKKSIDNIKEKIPELFLLSNSENCKEKENIDDQKYFEKLIKYILPINYHYNNSKYILDVKTNRFIRKTVLNKWYSTRLNEINKELGKLVVSGFLEQIIDYFDNLIKKKSAPKMRLFFGHDTNIVELIAVLFEREFLMEKIKNALHSDLDYNFVVPQFASNLIFELHENDKGNDVQHSVRILYNGVEQTDHLNNLLYDREYKGILFNNFKSGLEKSIDDKYKELVCMKQDKPHRKGFVPREDDDEDYLSIQPANTKFRFAEKKKNFLKN